METRKGEYQADLQKMQLTVSEQLQVAQKTIDELNKQLDAHKLQLKQVSGRNIIIIV